MHKLISSFLLECGLNRSAETMRQYRWNMQVFEEYAGKKGIDILKVKKCDIERFLLLSASAQLRQRRLHIIRRFYDYRNKRGHRKIRRRNPTEGITVYYRADKIIRNIPGIGAVDTLASSVRGQNRTTVTRNRLLLELAYGSGLRRCELMGLNMEDVDFRERTARIRGKGSRVRLVPLTEKTLELIEEYLLLRRTDLNGPLFISGNTGRRLTNTGISHAFRNNIGIRPHLLRHACATHMLDNGCGIRHIQELLGHKNITVTQRYTSVSKKKLAEIVNSRHPRNAKNGIGAVQESG